MVNCYVSDIADLQKYLEHFQKLEKNAFVNVCTRSFCAFASKPENLAFKAVIVHIQ